MLVVCQVARLAQSVERKALNLVVVGSSPTVGVTIPFSPRLLFCLIRYAHFASSAPFQVETCSRTLSKTKRIDLFPQPQTDPQVSPSTSEVDPGQDARIYSEVAGMYAILA